MKYVLCIAVLFFGFISCTIDDGVDFHYELLPVDSVELPDEFKRDSIYEIPFKYSRPTTCYAFDGFYYRREANVRTIAIGTIVFEQNNCRPPTTNPLTAVLYFKPTVENSYIFKIWKGKDTNGQNIFEETEIPVIP
ncbi:hypothetical protein [Flavobacterium sp. H122]|uniref:hypothetical protein n=1 Tax=Flavobacterium sp. H122 TaxID=2529860 RepID=UPI0010AAFF69|nr:hypothetical protein [Flavobacterium sp. H122]